MNLQPYIFEAARDVSHDGVDRWVGTSPNGNVRAVWVLSPHATPEQRDEFEARARSVQRVNHPAFGMGWEVDLERGLVAAGLVQGVPLPQYVMQHGPFESQAGLRLGRDLAEAFIEVHSFGFTHGHFAPVHVLMNAAGLQIAGLDPFFSNPHPQAVKADLRGVAEVLRFAVPSPSGALESIIGRASGAAGQPFLSAVHLYGELCDCTRVPEPGTEALPWDEIGGWVLDRELGRGGFGRVFAAHRGPIKVALKVLMRGDDQHFSDVRRFKREAEFAAMLRSPGTIQLIEHGQDAGVFYIAFEHVDGETLSERFERGPMSSSEVLRLYRTMLASLEEAHNLGIMHRDIKPANIMLDRDGNAKLLDFGIAKLQGDILEASTKLTATGNVLGTPRYISPEALLGEQVTPASDLYSLGLVMYEALVGEPAATGDSSFRWISSHLSGDEFRLPPGPWAPQLVAAINGVIRREQRDRIQRASAVRELLDSHAPMPTTRSPDQELENTTEAPPRQRSMLAPPSPSGAARLPTGLLVAILGLIIVAIAVTAYLGFGSHEEEPPAPLAQSIQKRPVVPGVVAGTEEEPEAPAPVPVDGCGVDAPFKGMGQLEAFIGLQSFKWDVYIPTSYDPSRRYPTVVVFNGVGRTPRRLIRETGMDELAERDGFVLIGVSNSDDILTPWMSWEPDLPVLALEESRAKLCLDPERLYAFGHGSGGRAAESLPCVAKVAAVASSSFRGRKDGDLVCERTAVPYLQLSPLHDGTAPVEGGRGCSPINKQPLARKIKQWRKIQGCSGAERTISTHSGGECVSWKCDTPYEVCRLDGGRRWPSMKVTLTDMEGCDDEPAEFPHADTVWKFFNRFGGP